MLVSSLNDGSVNIVNDKISFEFSPKAQFTSPLYIHIILAADTEAESQHLTEPLQCWKYVEILSIEMALKPVIA